MEHNQTPQQTQTTPDSVLADDRRSAPATPAGRPKSAVWLVAVAGALIVGAGGGYAIGHHGSSSAQSGGANGVFGGRGMGSRMNGSFGTVSAVSNSSITVKNQRDDSSVTYSITSSTTVTNDGASAKVTDIKTGDRVLVRTGDSSNSSTTKVATSIQLNPSMRGGGMAPGDQTDGSSSGASDQAADPGTMTN